MPPTPTRFEQRNREAQQLLGYATFFDPVELYDAIDRPIPDHLPSIATVYISTRFENSRERTLDVDDLLAAAISDTGRMLTTILEHHPGISIEQALIIARHERTVLAVAKIARQQLFHAELLIDKGTRAYDLGDGEDHIETASQVTPNLRRGCPAVEISPEVKPSPLFQRVVPWAGHLSLLAYFLHGAAHDDAHARESSPTLV
jgi:hypothetical protein